MVQSFHVFCCVFFLEGGGRLVNIFFLDYFEAKPLYDIKYLSKYVLVYYFTIHMGFVANVWLIFLDYYKA